MWNRSWCRHLEFFQNGGRRGRCWVRNLQCAPSMACKGLGDLGPAVSLTPVCVSPPFSPPPTPAAVAFLSSDTQSFSWPRPFASDTFIMLRLQFKYPFFKESSFPLSPKISPFPSISLHSLSQQAVSFVAYHLPLYGILL